MNPLHAARPIAQPATTPALAGSPLRDLGADLVSAGVPLPGGVTLILPNSADQCAHIRAFAAHCAENLDLHHASNDAERYFRIGEEVSLMLQHGVNPHPLLGAIALCKAGVLPANLPGQPVEQHWAHHLAQHGFEAPEGFADTLHTPPMSLQQRFAALAEAGLSLGAEGDAPPAIIAAVEADNAATLDALLSMEAHPQSFSHEGLSLVHYAAAHDAIDVFESLLARGFSAGLANLDNVTPLHVAAANGSLMVIERLSQLPDTSIDTRNIDGHTALHLAANHGQTGAARLLLQNGASTGLVNAQGEKAIHLAAKSGHEELVALLLASAPQAITDRTLSGDTAMHIAARHGHTHLMQTLARASHGALIGENHRGCLPLHTAAESGQLRAVEWLLEVTPEALNAEDRRQETPLYLAVDGGYIEVFRLLNARPDLDQRLISNQVPSLLAAAASGGHLTVMRELALTPGFNINAPEILCITIMFSTSTHLANLLKAPGIDLNRRDLRGETPLHLAARLGKTDMVRELIKRPGIDVSRLTPDGRTALHLAAKNGNEDIVRVLLKDGRIDRLKQNHHGKTAADLALESGYASTHRLLADEPGNNRPSAARATREGRPSSIMQGHAGQLGSLLGAPQTDINERNLYGWTALHLAATRGDPMLTERLIGNPSIRINERGPDALTALHLAARHGNVRTLRLLLAVPDIEVDALSERGRTPLHEAAAAGQLDAVRTLITDRRVRPAARTRDGHDARSLAREANQLDIVALLSQVPAYQAGTGMLARAPGLGWLFGR